MSVERKNSERHFVSLHSLPVIPLTIQRLSNGLASIFGGATACPLDQKKCLRLQAFVVVVADDDQIFGPAATSAAPAGVSVYLSKLAIKR